MKKSKSIPTCSVPNCTDPAFGYGNLCFDHLILKQRADRAAERVPFHGPTTKRLAAGVGECAAHRRRGCAHCSPSVVGDWEAARLAGREAVRSDEARVMVERAQEEDAG